MTTFLKWLTNDGRLILGARILRTFSYGFLSIVLAIYLKLIGLNDFTIGIILSSTLVNSIIFNLVASFYADRFGRRKMLILYSFLMAVSGAIFLVTTNYILLIIAALIGTVNVTGSETGAFLSIEQAILPSTIINDTKKRNTLFALYNMAGTFAMSAGILVSGLPQFLQHSYGLGQIESIKPLFILYSLLGISVSAIYFLLSSKIEIEQKTSASVQSASSTSRSPSTAIPSISLLSPKSKSVITKLSALFAVDSFAGGFVIQSIVSFWFFTRFGFDLITLSYIFSIAGVLTAFSFIAAAKLADRIGLINTMVFTHIPSNILLILVAIAPTPFLAIAFYLARMALSQMDVPTRQAFIVLAVRKEERQQLE